MKAAVLYGNEDIRYEEIEKPKAGKGEVIVRVAMSGICGSDVPRVLYNGAHYYPIILGHEFSGIIDEIGEGVENLSVGQRVSGAPLLPCMKCDDCRKGNFSLCKHYSFIGSREAGSFAEYVKIPAVNAIPFDDSVSFERGALFEPATVSLHGIMCADYRGGGRVAVIGTGTIGLFAMQWAKIYGAKDVTMFDISDERLEIARNLGADYTVNTSKEQTDERFDCVLECAGQPATTLQAFELAANKATVCFIGTPHKDVTFTPRQWENMNRKEFRLTGSWMSYSAPFPGKEWELTAHFFGNGQLKYHETMVYRKYHLSTAQEAFQEFKTPGAVTGRIMLYNDL